MNILERLRSDGEQARAEAARRARLAIRGEGRGLGWMPAAILTAGGAIAGAIAAFLLDPARGRARRARFGDQAAATVRRGVREAERLTRRVRSDVGGRINAMQRAGSEVDPFPDDVTLAAKVQSELFRDPNIPKGSINVNVERGIVVLRGEVTDESMRGDLVSRVEGMPSVWAVRNLLHLPGETAPQETVAAS